MPAMAGATAGCGRGAGCKRGEESPCAGYCEPVSAKRLSSIACNARRIAAKIASIWSPVMIGGGEIINVSAAARIRMLSSS